RFIPPIPKLAIAVPSAAPRLGDGGDAAPIGTIVRPPWAGRNGKLRRAGIAPAARNVAGPPQPKTRSPPYRSPSAPRRGRPARASAQRGMAHILAASGRAVTTTSC